MLHPIRKRSIRHTGELPKDSREEPGGPIVQLPTNSSGKGQKKRPNSISCPANREKPSRAYPQATVSFYLAKRSLKRLGVLYRWLLLELVSESQANIVNALDTVEMSEGPPAIDDDTAPVFPSPHRYRQFGELLPRCRQHHDSGLRNALPRGTCKTYSLESAECARHVN